MLTGDNQWTSSSAAATWLRSLCSVARVARLPLYPLWRDSDSGTVAYDNATAKVFFATRECNCWTDAASARKPRPRSLCSIASRVSTPFGAGLPLAHRMRSQSLADCI